jgi:tetratricopeptide (TPR) repeat protein
VFIGAKGKSRKRITVMALVVILLTVLAFQRNGIYRTKLSLWTDVASKSPSKSRVHSNLGNCYMLLGDRFKAVEEYRLALALDKGNIEAYYNMAINLEWIGLARESLDYYTFFCRSASSKYPAAAKIACEKVKRLTRELGLKVR